MKEKFKVTGMTCSACSSRVEKTVTKIDGTREVSRQSADRLYAGGI